MNTKKTELRNKLFEKYFEENDGIILSDLMNNSKFIIEIWKNLHKFLKQNVEYFDNYSHLEMIKKIEYNEKQYLIVKAFSGHYIIIDLTSKQSLTKNDVQSIFDEQFFIDNFSEKKLEFNGNYTVMYCFLEYNSNVQDLIDFYNDNRETLDIPSKIYYSLTIDEALTYLSINLANANVQLGFHTPDQFLYEHLFFNADLTPFRMQDAQSKIGVDKMKEMFARVKDIKVPKTYIPSEIYQRCLTTSHNNGPQLIKKK